MDVRVRRGLVGLAAVAALWVLVAVLQLARVAGDLRSARADLLDVQDAIAANDLQTVTERLSGASREFASARSRLEGAAVLPLRVTPVAARHVRVLRHLSSAGESAAKAGDLVVTAIAELPDGMASLTPRAGALPIEAYDSLAEPVRHADALLARGARELQEVADVPVLEPVDEVRQQALQLVPAAADAMHRAAAMLPVLDELLGGREPRRYLFLAQNPAESRGTGGFIGAYSILTMDQGRFSFGGFSEIQDLPAFPVNEVVPPSAEYAARYNRYGGAGFWHNINMTPDFPTAARAMEALYAQGTGREVDGVIAVDPFALQALLEVAGPVDVPGFGTVGPDDVIDVVSNRAHAEIRDSEARKALLGAVAVGAFEGFLRAESAERPLETAQTLIDVMRSGHLLLRSSVPEVQAALLTARVAGALAHPPGDFAAVITNAGSAAKLDYYIDRTVTYRVQLHDDGSGASTLETAFANDAPSEGVSARVIGPNTSGLEAGEQRLIVSVYAPDGAFVETFSRTGGDRPMLVGRELGHMVFDTVVQIPSGDSQSLTVSWRRPETWEPDGNDGGRYRLTLQGQPTLRPTSATIEVTLPPGMVIASLPPGLERVAADRVRFRGTLESRIELQVSFAREGGRGLWGRLRRWWSQPLATPAS